MAALAHSTDFPFILIESIISSRREAIMGIWLLGRSSSIQRMASRTLLLGSIALSWAMILVLLSQSRLNQTMALTTQPIPIRPYMASLIILMTYSSSYRSTSGWRSNRASPSSITIACVGVATTCG